MKLAEIVINYRTSQGMSARAFAEKCGVSHSYIPIIERGINPNTGETIVPTLPMLKKIASGMNLTLDDLLKMADDMPISMAIPSDEEIKQKFGFTYPQFKTWLDCSTESEKLEMVSKIVEKMEKDTIKKAINLFIEHMAK